MGSVGEKWKSIPCRGGLCPAGRRKGDDAMNMPVLNPEVTTFLDTMNHPLRDLIEYLRGVTLSAGPDLVEGIKWNGPNYSLFGEDRITMRINPPKQVQVVLHCGAKVKEQPKERLIKDDSSLLDWKSNDRAVLTFRSLAELHRHQAVVKDIVAKWLTAASERSAAN